jgi:outer membrane protein assembly factor BamB
MRLSQLLCVPLVFSALASVLHAPVLHAGDWPTARGDAWSTGFADEKLPDHPEFLWEFKKDKSGFEGTAVIADGKVWIGDVEGKMFCLDLATGKEIWSSSHKNGFIVSPAYRDGKVVIGDFDGHIYCFAAPNGSILWETDLSQAIAGGANFIDNMVLLTSEAGQLFALDLATGKQLWEYATGDQLRSAATLWNDYALLGGCDGRLHKINVRTGSAEGDGLLLDGPSGSTPAILDTTAIVPTQSGQVLAFDIEKSIKKWSFADAERSQEIRSSPAVAVLGHPSQTAIAVVTTRSRRVLGLEIDSGKMLWEAVVRKRCDASPVICDGRVWVGGLDGTLYAFDLQSGEERWSYSLTGQLIASPSISNGKIVVATDKGVVTCFGSKN